MNPLVERILQHTAFSNLIYLVAAVLFIVGLKLLGSPRTAVRGNLLGALGMLLAILVTLSRYQLLSSTLIWAGVAVGTVVGIVWALKVPMTAMPETVAMFNGFGGLASVLVAGGGLIGYAKPASLLVTEEMIATGLAGIIGGVTFTGSALAFCKLREYKQLGANYHFPGQLAANALMLAICGGLTYWLVMAPGNEWPYLIIAVLSFVLGVTLVMSIGGADMPVVICLLNSYSGMAGCATGFVLQNNVLIIAGSLVGASGIILCQIMCKAMNRSLANVFFGKFAGGGGPSADDVYGGKVKSTTPEEVAMLMDGARRVCVVPGYGMAVAQAQHAVRDLTNTLSARGVSVEFGIHPVAGRMPGHMNVLLAEADIPYDKMREMDDINPDMPEMDVCVVLGANDTVNPIARTDPKSPIAGMPIIDADKARTVIVIKRSLAPGFAGIPNPLFAAENTLMLFGDGKKALMELNSALKEK